ncbi:LolA family protein [Kordiimonas gwangyangensis]|uniref:LolA family protein n=1 Tax=Kordiimonas gwangyangensis TaxID=288022 RepID=UPI000367CAD2|nr:outer membrane lipoprotein carrier protein LolA [Kordiimonas gwangyangensis]
MRFGVMFSLMMALSLPAAAQQKVEDELPPLEEKVLPGDQNLRALGDIQDYMKAVTSIKAKFRQHSPNGTVAEGTLYLERPGYIRFDYTDDTPFLVVADGKTLNFVDYEIGQVSKWPVKDTPLRALLGNSVDLAALGAHIELEPAGAKGVIALTAQDNDRPELGTITLYFRKINDTKGGLQLTSWAVVDAEDRVTYVEIRDPQINVDIEDKLWTFEDPRGLSKRRRVRP